MVRNFDDSYLYDDDVYGESFENENFEIYGEYDDEDYEDDFEDDENDDDYDDDYDDDD